MARPLRGGTLATATKPGAPGGAVRGRRRARRPCPPRADRDGRGGQPQPHRGQRRPARHRPGLRRRPDHARPDRHRLLTRPGRVGALPGDGRRPLRPPDDASAGRAAVRPGLPDGRLRPGPRRAAGRPPARRDLRGHGLPHDPGPDHRAVVGARPDQGHRPVVRYRRRHHRPGAHAGRPGPAALLVGVGVPAHPAAGGRGSRPGPGLRTVTRQRDHGHRRSSGRRTVDDFRCGPSTTCTWRGGGSSGWQGWAGSSSSGR
jgi:hypothetical protein